MRPELSLSMDAISQDPSAGLFCISEKEQLRFHHVDGVILCTSPNGKKHEGMKRNLISFRPDLPIVAATPHDIEESFYNEQYGKSPDVIAASKVLQVARRYPGIIENGLFAFDITKSIFPIFIANDVILETPEYNGKITWKVHNKPAQEADIFETLQSILHPQENSAGYCEARIRCGAAAYDPKHNRGLMGVVEVPFWFIPFSDAEIRRYMKKFSDEALRNTNGSCRWDDPEIFEPHLVMIDNVMVSNAEEFPKAKQYFHQVLTGSLPHIGSLVEQLEVFSQKNTNGKTSVIKEINEEYHICEDPGIWGIWWAAYLHRAKCF